MLQDMFIRIKMYLEYLSNIRFLSKSIKKLEKGKISFIKKGGQFNRIIKIDQLIDKLNKLKEMMKTDYEFRLNMLDLSKISGDSNTEKSLEIISKEIDDSFEKTKGIYSEIEKMMAK